MSASELLDQALKLPPIARKAFAEQLWQSLAGECLESDDEWSEPDPAFVEELRRRVELVKSGKYESVSFQEAIEYARSKLTEVRP